MIAEGYKENGGYVQPPRYPYADKEDYQRPVVSHYQSGGIEPIDYITAHNMNFNCGNVIKYVTRAGKKEGESPLKDLKKARDYINFEIERISRDNT